MQALIIASSAAMKAVGALKEGQAQAANYKSAAQANLFNAQVAEGNARAALEQANAREESQRRQFGQLQGQALAAAAQSGAGFGGSNADVLRQSAANNELDALTIRYEGQMQSGGLMGQAQQERYQAAANRKNAGRAMKAGYINAASSILSGGSDYYNRK